jgi:FkbM family methyltransferase
LRASASLIRYDLLCRNLDEAALQTRVAALPLALGRAPCRAAPLTVFPHLPGNSTFHPDLKAAERRVAFAPSRAHLLAEGASTVDVQVDTLSAVLASRGISQEIAISLLKIDTEGAELDVLVGMSDTDWTRVLQV